MTGALPALARQVLTDAIRERALHTALLYLAITALLAPWVGDLALGAPTRAAQDLGLTLAWLVASGVAVWLGIRAVGWELHHRTAALLLARPISRGRWLIGRLLGVAGVLALEVAALVVAHVIVLAWVGAWPTAALAWFALLLWAECCVVAAVSALLGVLVRPAMAASLAVALWAAGHLADEYAVVAPLLARVVFAVVPDLDLFNVHAALVYGDAIDPVRGLGALGYAGLWCAGLTALATVAVNRRDVA